MTQFCLAEITCVSKNVSLRQTSSSLADRLAQQGEWSIFAAAKIGRSDAQEMVKFI